MDKNTNKTVSDTANKNRTEFADEMNNDTDKKAKQVNSHNDKR